VGREEGRGQAPRSWNRPCFAPAEFWHNTGSIGGAYALAPGDALGKSEYPGIIILDVSGGGHEFSQYFGTLYRCRY